MAVVPTAPVRDPATGDLTGSDRAEGLRAVTLVPRSRTRRSRSGIGRFLYRSGNVISTMSFVLFLFLAVGPHLFAYRTETMLTGSMVPAIKVGDVAVVTRTPVGDLRPGTIVTYHIPVGDHRVVSHRIVSITPEPDGSVTVATKGDANPSNDPWTANFAGGTVWQVRTVIPKIGMGIRLMREPAVSRVSRYVAPALLVLLAMSAIWKSPARRRTEPDPHDVQQQNSPFAAGSHR